MSKSKFVLFPTAPLDMYISMNKTTMLYQSGTKSLRHPGLVLLCSGRPTGHIVCQWEILP
jgi:hypothetical protein